MPWLKRVRAPQRLLFVFAATVVGPALLLGFFGVRAIVQEREFARRQVRERLRASVETITRRAELEVSAWQQAVDQVAHAGPASPALWPERVRKALADSRSAVVLIGSDKNLEAFPAANVLYRIGPEPAPRLRASPLLDQAESLELREGKLDQAAGLYRRVLAEAGGTQDATIALHHLGRTLKKAGRDAEAIAAFEQLRNRPPVLIGSLPSDLLARVALVDMEHDSALDLYRDLVAGRWQLAKPSYLFYSQKVRASSGELEQTERRKMALTSAAERFLENPRHSPSGDEPAFIAFWCAEPFAALVVSEPSLGNWFWPAVFGSSPDRDLSFSVITTGGAVPDPSHAVEQTVQLAGLPIRLAAWPKNPDALYRQAGVRQNFYLVMIGGVVALLAFGSYLVVRTVRAELAVAQMQAGFVSTVSHEFRSPLAGINQLAEMLRDGRVKDDERRQNYYEMIVNETQRLRRLVENVLDFSRMEEGRKQYRREMFDTAAWLAEMADDFRREAAGFDVAADIPKDLPPLYGDREALTTAVHNLLDNAAKYSNGAKSIRMEARVDGEHLVIAVQDYGAGISEKDKPRIFEKFYRGAETAQDVKGAGLGLSLVKHIVSAHGGVVSFESGKGATFTIRLRARR